MDERQWRRESLHAVAQGVCAAAVAMAVERAKIVASIAGIASYVDIVVDEDDASTGNDCGYETTD